MALEITLGDVVRFKKAHPCGGDTWQVVRIGADIGIRCQKCGRRVLMSRSIFKRNIKDFISHGK